MSDQPPSEFKLAPISVTDTTSLGDYFEPFFGSPSRPLEHDPYQQNSRHTLTLPEAYKGTNTYLGLIIDRKMENTQTFWTSVILPTKLEQNNSVQLNRWVFDKHYADVVPELATSRLVTSSKSVETHVFVRHGLALELEHGFMTTPEGVMHYQEHLRQLADSIQETTNYDVFYTLLSSHDEEYAWQMENGYFKAENLVRIMEREKFRWAITQKEKHGFERMQAEINETMTYYGGEADTWIIPPRLETYLNTVPKERIDYSLAGPAGPLRVNRFDSVVPVGYLGRSQVFIARQVEVDIENTKNMMTRERQIGEYMLMIDRAHGTNYNNYESLHRSIEVYDEDDDDWAILDLRTAVLNSHLFDNRGNVAFPANTHTGLNDKKDIEDDFLLMETDGGLDPVQIFGQIRPKHLGDDAIRGVTTTLVANLTKKYGDTDQLKRDIADGIDAVDDLRNAPLSIAWLQELIPEGAAEGFEDNFPVEQKLTMENRMKVWKAANFGTFALPDITDKNITTYAGLGNWAGLRALANEYKTGGGTDGLTAKGYQKSQLEKITRFVNAIRALVRHLRVIMPGSPIFKTEYQSPLSVDDTAENNLLDYILGYSGTALWAKPAFAKGDVRSAATRDNIVKEDDVTNHQAIVRFHNVLTDVDLKARLRTIFGVKENDDGTTINQVANPTQAQLPTAKAMTYLNIMRRNAAVTLMKDLKVGEGNKNLKTVMTAYLEIVETHIASIGDTNAFVDAIIKNSKIFNSTIVALKSTVERMQQQVSAAIQKDRQIEIDNDNHFDSMYNVVESHAVPQYLDADSAAYNADAFYRTPLTVTAKQIKELANAISIDNDKLSGASRLTVSAPGSAEQSPASPAQLRLMVDRINQARAGGAGLDIMPHHMYMHVDRERFDRNPLRHLMTISNTDGSGKRARETTLGEDAYRKRARTDGYGHDYNRDAMEVNMNSETRWYGSESVKETDDRMTATDVFTTQWERVNSLLTGYLEQMLGRLFLITPVTRSVCLAFVEHDIVLPLNFIVFRHLMRYMMHLGIYCKAGETLGHTYFGHTDFQLSDDAVHKKHFGHLTYYEKAVVENHKNSYIAWDFFAAGTMGGGGVVPFNLDTYHPNTGQYGGGSIAYIALPSEERKVPNPMDASGYFAQFNLPGILEIQKPHYSTRVRYNSLYGFQTDIPLLVERIIPSYHPHTGEDVALGKVTNTVMWYGETHFYSPERKGYTIRHINTGHWGPYVYPGCKAGRMGNLTQWQPARNTTIMSY